VIRKGHLTEQNKLKTNWRSRRVLPRSKPIEMPNYPIWSKPHMILKEKLWLQLNPTYIKWKIQIESMI